MDKIVTTRGLEEWVPPKAHAFGIQNETFTDDAVKLAAATNVFVGVTRPRHFLGLAMRKAAATAGLLSAASAQQWRVIDLTDEASQVENSGGTP
jgi:hypothetical protein